MHTEALLQTLAHIKEVQENISALNHQSMTTLGDDIFSMDIDLNEDSFVALQHQDILTQQLSATNDLIEKVSQYLEEDRQNLKQDILEALDEAKAKKEAFSGNAFEEKHPEHVV